MARLFDYWYFLRLNPEPWAVGPLDIGRRSGKMYATIGQNQQLAAYQEAVRAELRVQDPVFLEGRISLTAWFWRNRAEYTTPNQRQHRKHDADGTNMFKALEDACQGILFSNDRDTVTGKFYLVDQGPDIEGKVLLRVHEVDEPDIASIPNDIWQNLHLPPTEKADNSWPPK